MDGLPLLDSKQEEAPLIRITARIEGSARPVHAVLTAVQGRVFCMSLSEPVSGAQPVAPLEIQRVQQAWRSNVRVPPGGGPLA